MSKENVESLRSPKVVEQERRDAEISRSKGLKVRLNSKVLRMLVDSKLPCMSPNLLGDIKRDYGVSEVMDLSDLYRLSHRLIDIKNELYSIGLREGFMADTNLANKVVFGVLSDCCHVLVGADFESSLKEKMEGLVKEVNELKKLKTGTLEYQLRKERVNKIPELEGSVKDINKALSCKKALYEMFSSTVLVSPSDKLFYYNILIAVVTVYLYMVSVLISSGIYLETTHELEVRFVKNDFEALSAYFSSRMLPSLRSKMTRVLPKITKQVMAGYDTEYKNIKYGKNELVSAQIAVTGRLLIEISTRTPFEFDTIHTITQESIRTQTLNHLKGLKMSSVRLMGFFEGCVTTVRQAKYGDYDGLMETLKLDLIKCGWKNKGDSRVKGKELFLNNNLSLFNKILYYKGRGLKWESLFSEIIDESGVNKRLNLALLGVEALLNKVDSSGIDSSDGGDVVIEGVISDRVLCDCEGPNIKIKSGLVDKDVSVNVRNEVYLISHFNVADLSMIEDWGVIKEGDVNKNKEGNVDIIGKSYVTLRRPIELKGYNIILRDTMLLASAGQSLDKLGKMHKIPKIDIDPKWYTDIGYLAESEPAVFKEYALRDSMIALTHGLFVSDFAFGLGSGRMPASLGSLSRLSMKKFWDEIGYKGYQVDPEYMLGDSVKVCTPDGVNKLGVIGTAYNMFVGSYRGGRNEGLMYGVSREKFYDWDLTSCYTTVMSMMGNPDYKKARYLSEVELDAVCESDLMNSYTAMYADFKHADGTKYPIIPVMAEKKNNVYCMEGSALITGLEYLKLKQLKAEVKVHSCVYIPFEKGDDGELVNCPFSEFIKYVQSQRRSFKKHTCEERMWKDIGNMCYGSAVSGLSNKLKYNPRK